MTTIIHSNGGGGQGGKATLTSTAIKHDNVIPNEVRNLMKPKLKQAVIKEPINLCEENIYFISVMDFSVYIVIQYIDTQF